MFWHGEARVVVALGLVEVKDRSRTLGCTTESVSDFLSTNHLFFLAHCVRTRWNNVKRLRETSRVYFGDLFIWAHIWMFPKIMVPPNHPILIGFSIIFTIHFGDTPISWKQPYISTSCVIGWGETLSGGAHLLGSFLGRCNMVHGCSRLCQEVVSWRHHRSWSLILIPFSTPHPKIKNKSEKRNSPKNGEIRGGWEARSYVGDGIFHPTSQNPRRKAVVKQPVAPRWSDATHATTCTNAQRTETTSQPTAKPPPLERSPGFWKLTSSLGGWMYTGIINSELWNFVVWIWINPALRVLWKAMLFSDGCDGQKVVLPHFNVLCVSRCERFEFGDSKGRTWRCSKTGASQRKFRKREDNESGCLD